MKGNRDELVAALARLLAGKVVAQWSIGLQLRDPLAEAVRDVRAASGLFGYPTVEDAERDLRQLLTPPAKRKRTADAHR